MATEKRLIDANALGASVSGIGKDIKRPRAVELACLLMINEAPTVDAVEVVHGRWRKNWCGNGLLGHEYAECSVCLCHMLDTNQFWNSKYCPNCGAKMDGDGNA